jgi:hypothetical protein
MSQDLIPHKRAWNYTGMLVMSENKTPGWREDPISVLHCAVQMVLLCGKMSFLRSQIKWRKH